MPNETGIEEIRQRTAKNFGIMLSREFAMKGLAFFGQLVLFRLLTPKDFGLFAIIAFIVSFFQLFTDVGLTSALIQSKELPSREGLSAAFFFKQSLALVCFMLIIFISQYLHLFYKDFNLEQVQMVRVLSLTLLLNPVQTFLTALLERELRYEIISLIDISGVVVYEIAAIIFALLHFSVWSFILAILIKESLQCTIIILYKRWMPSKSLNKKELKNLLKFGVFIQAQGFLAFFHDSLNAVVVGSRLGPYQVGLIDFSTGIVSVNKQVTDNYSRVAFASFSRIQEHPEELGKNIKRAIVFLAIFACYFVLIVFGLGKDIIHYMFTDKWLPALPVLYLMAVSSLLTSIYAPICATLLAQGKSKQVSHMIFVTTCLEWVISILGIGLIGFLAVPIAGLVVVGISIIWTFYLIKLPTILHDLIKIIVPKLLSICLLLLILQAVSGFFPQNFISLIAKGICLTAAYLASLYIVSPEEFKELLKIKKYVKLFS